MAACWRARGGGTGGRVSAAAAVLELAGPPPPAPPGDRPPPLRDIRSELSLRRQSQDMADRHERLRQVRYELWLNAREVPWRHDGGQALIEYALVISLIAMVALVALATTGTWPF